MYIEGLHEEYLYSLRFLLLMNVWIGLRKKLFGNGEPGDSGSRRKAAVWEGKSLEEMHGSISFKWHRKVKMGKKAIKRIGGSLLCILLVLSLAGCGAEKERDSLEALPVIRVGSDSYPPYNYLDEDGVSTGIDVELATEALRRMGYRAEIVMINWEEKKELLESGEIDCIWGCFSMEGRLADYRWAGPYMVSNQVVAVKENSDIYTLADLEGKNIAVQSTTKPEGIFLRRTDERIPKIDNLISLNHRELMYSFLEKDYAEAIAAHETSILQYMKDYDVVYRILEEPLMTVGIGVAFARNDTRGICEQLDETLEEMRKDGTAEKIIGKYLDNPEKYLEVEQLDY